MPKLLDLFVEFSLKGNEKIQAGIQAVSADMDKLGAAAQSVGGSLGAQFATASALLTKELDQKLRPAVAAVTERIVGQVAQLRGYNEAQAETLRRQLAWQGGMTQLQESTARLQARLEPLARVGMVGFASLTGAVMGFVRSGLAGTAQGEQLSLAFERLSMGIASIFLPLIEKVTQWVEKAAAWFRGLTGEQQESLRNWLLLGAGTLAFLMLLPRMIGLFQGLMTLWRGLNLLAVQLRMSVTALSLSLAGIGVAVGALLSVWAEMGASYRNVIDGMINDNKRFEDSVKTLGDKVEFGLGAMWEHKFKTLMTLASGNPVHLMNAVLGDFQKAQQSSLMKSGGSIEAVEATWTRMAQASTRVGFGGKTPEEETAENTALTVKALGGIKGALDGLQPPVGR